MKIRDMPSGQLPPKDAQSKSWLFKISSTWASSMRVSLLLDEDFLEQEKEMSRNKMKTRCVSSFIPSLNEQMFGEERPSMVSPRKP